MVRIRLETLILAPREVVYDLARNVGVHEEGAKGSGERAVAGVTSGLLQLGDSVTWRARHLGLCRELTVRITEMRAPESFVDGMERGAFRSMRHAHLFEATAGGTMMTDEFEFEAPFGFIGRIVEVLVLETYMRRLLMSRAIFLKARAEGASPYDDRDNS